MTAGARLSQGGYALFAIDRQRTRTQVLTAALLRSLKPLRYARKLSDGGGLYLLLVPTGGRYWRYNYRFDGKYKTVALGTYPDISLAKARARHREARRQVALGIDPALEKRALGKRAFERSSA